MSFPVYKQLDTMDCGPTCLRMVARYYGKTYSLQTLRERSFITRLGRFVVGDQRCGGEHRDAHIGGAADV